MLGQIQQDDPLLESIVDAVGCAAVSVEWRRPPEHPFPAPMNDCYAGLAWTHKSAAELRIDPQRIAVGGASSGGGSAAGLALLARDRGELPICFQLLVYPMPDDRNVTPASLAVTDPKVWNRASNLIGWRAYVGDAVGTEAVSPYAAPTRATDLSGLPPAYVPWRCRPVPGRGHRVRAAAAAGRGADRAARLSRRHPRLRPAGAGIRVGPAVPGGPGRGIAARVRRLTPTR